MAYQRGFAGASHAVVAREAGQDSTRRTSSVGNMTRAATPWLGTVIVRDHHRRPKGPIDGNQPFLAFRSSLRTTCMVNSPIRFMSSLGQFRLNFGSALAFLERGVDPADRFLTPLLEPEDLYAQLARQKLHRLVTQKPQNDLTLARHRPSLAKSQRACR